MSLIDADTADGAPASSASSVAGCGGGGARDQEEVTMPTESKSSLVVATAHDRVCRASKDGTQEEEEDGLDMLMWTQTTKRTGDGAEEEKREFCKACDGKCLVDGRPLHADTKLLMGKKTGM